MHLNLDELDKYPIVTWEYPKVLLGIPPERAMSYVDMVFNNFMRIAAQGPAMIDAKYGRIDVVRNLMALKLLQSPFTHLVMLDMDHKHPIDVIQKLARWFIIHPDIDVVSGLNFRRKAPYDPVAGHVNGHRPRDIMVQWDNGLMPVDETGAAAIMISKRAFEKIPPPWFFNIYDRVWENDWPGEDIGFCEKCKKHGIQVYVDTTLTSPHCTESLVDESTFRAYVKTHPEEFELA